MSEISFARILATVREAQGLSKSELAQVADIDPTLISRLERGARLPSNEVIERLTETLKVNFTSPEVVAAVKLLSGGGISHKSLQG